MRRAAIAMTSVALLAAGCGGEKAASTGIVTTGGSSDGPQRVTMKGLEFHPAKLQGKVGRPISFDNRDTVAYDVVAKDGARFRSDRLGPGGTFEFTPNEPGRITYESSLHPGMEGTLTIEK